MELHKRAKQDPRFNTIKQKDLKVKIDERFSNQLKNNKEFKRVQKKDQYGRQNKQKQQLDQFYDYQEDEKSYSDFSEESSSGSRISYKDAIVIEQDDNVWDETQIEKIQEIEKETDRLALVNFDWSRIKARDIMILLNSFKQTDGAILSVQIYKSEFGKERLEQEILQGPANIWKEKKEENEKEQLINKEGNGRQFNKDLWSFRREDEQGIDMFKLRKYELERLKYYFAVIKCDCVKTAKSIYDNMDGMEYEQTGLKIDLRYLTIDQKLIQENFVEECTEVTQNYNKNEFIFRALGQTNVTLSWDQPNYDRFNNLDDNYDGNLDDVIADEQNDDVNDDDNDEQNNDNNENDDDNDDYHNEDDEILIEFDNNDNQINKKQSKNFDWRQDFNSKSNRNKREEQNIEITFNTGFKTDIVNNIQKKKEDQEKSVFQKYLDKRQQKNKVKKFEKKQNQKQQEQEQKILDQQNNYKQQQQLELLVDKKEKTDDFIMDFQDDRFFKPITQDNRFNIDPTSKYFNKDKQKLLDFQVKQRKKVKL